METNDIISIIVSVYKDKVEMELLQSFMTEYNNLLQAEADARRIKSTNIIKQIAALKIALSKFEFTYEKIKAVNGKIDEIEKYIYSIESKIKRLSFEKNNITKAMK